jgi:hypothetical protein
VVKDGVAPLVYKQAPHPFPRTPLLSPNGGEDEEEWLCGGLGMKAPISDRTQKQTRLDQFGGGLAGGWPSL